MGREECKLCGDTFRDGHEWVDHMTEEHDAFSKVLQGRLPTHA